MSAYEKATSFLSDGLQQVLSRVPTILQQKVQEIRLRLDGLLTLSMDDGEWTVESGGTLSERPGPRAVYCKACDIEKTFLKLCDYSVHTHSEELKEGFVTAAGGFRAGIAGTAVMRGGEVTAVRSIKSICLRVVRRHDGCAGALLPLFGERLPSVLIAGEPSSGKTSMLRDIARLLSNGAGGRRRRVCVVDERGEISGTGGLQNADVLSFLSKPTGVLQAVRTLAPEIVLVDELGSTEEVEAVTRNLHAGVPTVATAHCRDLQEALRRPAIRLALEHKVFDYIVFLNGRSAPGRVREIVEVDKIEMARGGCADTGGCVDWHDVRLSSATSCETSREKPYVVTGV